MSAFFAGRDDEGPDVVVGALPFDRDADDLLFQPERVEWGGNGLPNAPGATAACWAPPGPRIVADASATDYAAAVAAALSRIDGPHESPLKKVVLARRLRIEMPEPIDPCLLLKRLAKDPSVATYMVDLSEASGHENHLLIGATPELLVSRNGLAVASFPLAGSAPRSGQTGEDRAAAESLLASSKDLREHRFVVEAILDGLAPLCAELSTPMRDGLRSTATMWHLGTRIEGRLKSADAPSAAGLAALLHPTPAVGGYPREAALAAIRELEPQGRGFYAGSVGWTDARGDGEFHVALRCAEISGSQVTLHAGAGIVAGSQPENEVAETSAKFRAMLQALGVDEEVVLEAVQ